ncbi:MULTISPECIES: hypothetical protein [unclassified Nostoc]|nr:hypothetical protein [Nostoc sp. DedQUE03]MDZ8043986.1 hypothetical protein [Nostoc sp. DedQUE02]
MKNNFALFQNLCRDVALQRLYIQIHTSIQQHQKSQSQIPNFNIY